MIVSQTFLHMMMNHKTMKKPKDHEIHDMVYCMSQMEDQIGAFLK